MEAISLGLKTEKVVYKGEKCRKILSFSCYKIEDLPIKYFVSEPPICFEDKDELVVIFGNGDVSNFKVGKIYLEKDFHRAIRTIKFCGHKLHLINEEIKKLKAEWNGTEDFKI